MPANIGYITELIANYCNKALGHTALGPTGVNLCMVLYLTFRGMCSCIAVKKLKTPFIVRHGNILSVVSFWTVVHQRRTSVH